jgi:hypothetical protein
LLEFEAINLLKAMSGLLVWSAVAAACSVGCGFFTARQRGRLHKIQSIRSVTIEELHALQQGVAKEIGAGAYGEAVKLQADLVCEQPLIAPFSEESCIAYQNTIVEIFEELVTTTDSEGKTTRSWQKKERNISNEERRCDFSLQQGSHRVAVDPDGAEIDLIEIINRMEPGQLAPLGRSAGIEGAAGVALQLASTMMNANAGRGQGQSFRLIGYRREESIFPASGSVFVVAEASDAGGALQLRQPIKSGLFLIRNEGEERVLKSLRNSINLWTIGWLGFAVIALITLICGVMGLG